MKVRPIPVKAIAHKPLFVLAESIIDSRGVPRLTHHGQASLDNGAEQQPIAVVRHNRA
jgi:hypothetical protein